jgi:hypothetical protein
VQGTTLVKTPARLGTLQPSKAEASCSLHKSPSPTRPHHPAAHIPARPVTLAQPEGVITFTLKPDRSISSARAGMHAAWSWQAVQESTLHQVHAAYSCMRACMICCTLANVVGVVDLGWRAALPATQCVDLPATTPAPQSTCMIDKDFHWSAVRTQLTQASASSVCSRG